MSSISNILILPSIIPSPDGRKETAPARVEKEKMKTAYSKSIETLKAILIKKRPKVSDNHASIDKMRATTLLEGDKAIARF